MNDPTEKPDAAGLVREEFLATFEDRMAELERIQAVVAPLNERIPAFLKTQEVLKGTPLTMPEVINFTVRFLQGEGNFISLFSFQNISVHEVIREIAGTLWSHYQMRDYDYLHIDVDPAFTCSRKIEDALRQKLEAVGLVERPH